VAASVGLLLALACGGEAVVDDVAAGGSGTGAGTGTGTGAGTGTGTGTGSGTGPTCDTLEQDLAFWMAAAMACDPYINTIQCDGSMLIFDTCGCPVVANELNEDAAKAAIAAYEAWAGAGCGPYDCFACPPGPETPWYCDASFEACVPAYEGG
jgi:hypothetical protein